MHKQNRLRTSLSLLLLVNLFQITDKVNYIIPTSSKEASLMVLTEGILVNSMNLNEDQINTLKQA